MKKRIAVCANGWNYDSLLAGLDGIKEYASREDFDVYVFLSFASYSEHFALMRGELNIYNYMDPSDYDGVIVFSTALNSEETAVSICRKAKEAGVPVVSIGMEMEGIHSVCVSNDQGMKELVEHLIEEHGVKSAFFIGGTSDHVDSIARLRVTRELLESRGLPFSDDDVAYGRWANQYTALAVDNLIDSGRELPDAIICANDIMAMAACTELENRGYLVPEDIIVTGFDNCKEGKFFYPALSSVEQNYGEIVRNACDIILNEIRGNREIARKYVNSSFCCGESCGCKGEEDYEAARILYCRHSYKRNSDARLLEQNERVLRSILTDVPNYNVIKDELCSHYARNHQFEGEGFYICISRKYFANVLLSEEDLANEDKGDDLEELICLINGEVKSGLEVNAHKIVPGYVKKDGEQHVFFFMPMHSFDYNYGYVVLTDFPYLTKDDIIYPYMEKLQQSIRLMRINLRLKALSDKDQMTGLYNRFGYENKALPLYKSSVDDKSNVTVMFVDINYMKRINDKYGHLYGDRAIRTVVDAINSTLKEDAIAVRFGGDEFLLIVPDSDETNALDIKNSILQYLGDINAKKEAPYDLTVSIGYVVTDPVNRPEAVLQDYIREADNKMYEIKKEMHMRVDRRKM